MANPNAKPEGPADVGEPADEGGKVNAAEDPRRRNMSGRFPGEANEEVKTGAREELEANQEAKEARAQVVEDQGPRRPPSRGSAASDNR